MTDIAGQVWALPSGTMAAPSMRLNAIWTAAALLAVSCAAPEPRTARFTSVEAVGEAMTWFYRHPDEATFADLAHDLAAVEHEPALRNNGVETLFAVFLWRCVERYGYSIPESAGGRTVARARLLIDDAPVPWVAAIRRPQVIVPAFLDVCWMSYFATGDTGQLDRILAATRGASGSDVINVVTHAAKWSFMANTKQHASVLAYAKRQRGASRDEVEAAFLDDCISYAEAPSAASIVNAPRMTDEVARTPPDQLPDTSITRSDLGVVDPTCAGTYEGSEDGLSRKLLLRDDGTFQLDSAKSPKSPTDKVVSSVGTWAVMQNGDHRWLNMIVEHVDGTPVQDVFAEAKDPMHLVGHFTPEGVELSAKRCRTLLRQP